MKTLMVITRDEWRTWLEKNHKMEKEVWLIYYKKHTCKPRIPYDDAVEEAICYGWINAAKKDETRNRRIAEVAGKAAAGKRIGMK
ncbi:MAG: YdeI/OmpD-associated family protein [Bacteroidales bacterium]|nr:YdeI/OmpD-associated family protein [Bacteroidales bacterium]